MGQGGDKDPFTVSWPGVFEPDLRSMTRIVPGPAGPPRPLEVFTVAIGSALVGALQWGIIRLPGDRAVTLVERQAGVRRTL